MSNRQTTYNFNAGPSALPTVVLERAQEQLVNFEGNGMSIMEMSHRGKVYEAVHNAAIERLRKLYNIPADYDVLFLQGGASLQFSMIPMNFLAEGEKAGYIMTGSWSEKACKEATAEGATYEVASSKADNYNYIPTTFDVQEGTRYVHMTTNNTIFGTQFKSFPTFDVPLIADMSSDIMSKPIDVTNFDMIYAGAQKNLGPSGVTVVIIKKDFLATAKAENPTVLKYETHAKNNSLYHTPPTFGIYMLGEILKWIEEQGGLTAIDQQNKDKAALIYDVIDTSEGFYVGHATKESRSLMNITFRLQDEALEKQFLTEAAEAGFVGLNGHRSVGGCRASTYNAVPVAACQALADFMKAFMKKHN
ncbi:phosphoserine aminotransferase [Lysinibacillus alkalisoli]|uniref:Phosphoserine aminotransferase n=1 Tax=Lysinibacillus alkalisoli TaxID=1911548 RepID=A0A917FZQ8_9BACI|nr:3-phosphoserine/phosphohydroxythreonine transaminase [Lysinibacillus alkalisoli]GGG15607.1 phosphoserine aminotransferase [Lysinibacillus alkalisoli]